MYQVLARQWRPKNFHELVGQTHVAEALAYALDHNRIHHAHLFTGTRGVGKTTIARIFAKSLNCLTNGVSSHPCGTCEHCTEVDAGRFPDLIEVDAASRTGVDDTRDLLDNVPYAPVKGRYKVYLIDEVHMFSKSSFNALLKTLEEPPPHVKFILATTDPQKMPPTVLSRCLQFHLKNLTPRQIATHLADILRHEQTPFDDEALAMLARAGNGSMRDALSLLDQAIAFGQGEVRTAKVAGLLGAVPSHHFIALMEAMAHQDCAGLRRIVAEMDEYAPDYAALLTELMGQFQRVTILQLAAQQPDEYFEPALASLAGRLPVELMQLWYQIATDTWQYFPYQPNAKLAFEMMLLRMAALQPLFPNAPVKAVADLSTHDDETVQMAARLGQGVHAVSHGEQVERRPEALAEMPVKPPTTDNAPPAAPEALVEHPVVDTAQTSVKPPITDNAPPAAPEALVEHPVVDTAQTSVKPPITDSTPPAAPKAPVESPITDNAPEALVEAAAIDVAQAAPSETPIAAPEISVDAPQTAESNNDAPLPWEDDVPAWGSAHDAPAPSPAPSSAAPWEREADVAPPLDAQQIASDTATQALAPLPAEVEQGELPPLPALATTIGDVEAWSAYVAHLPKAGKVRLFADNSCPLDWRPPKLTLQIPFMMTGFDDGKRVQALAAAIAALSGEPCEIVLHVDDGVMTPHQWRNLAKEAEQVRAEQAFYEHGLTRALQAQLDAKVQPQSIQSMKTQTE